MPVSNNISYHDEASRFTLLRYLISIMLSFSFSFLFIKAVYKIQKQDVLPETDTIVMLQSRPSTAVTEKKAPVPKPVVAEKKPEVKTEQVKEVKIEKTEKTVVPEKPKTAVAKPAVRAEKPVEDAVPDSRKEWRSVTAKRDPGKALSVQTPDAARADAPDVTTARAGKRSDIFSSMKNETGQQHAVPGIGSPDKTRPGINETDFVPMRVPAQGAVFPSKNKTSDRTYAVAAIDAPAGPAQAGDEPEVRRALKKGSQFGMDVKRERNVDYENVIERPDISAPDNAGDFQETGRVRRTDSDMGELAAAGTEAAEGIALNGVPLSVLTACSNAREETILMEKILNVIGMRRVCSDAVNKYTFYGTGRISSFGMLIQQLGEGKLSDRCGELSRALKCLSAERN